MSAPEHDTPTRTSQAREPKGARRAVLLAVAITLALALTLGDTIKSAAGGAWEAVFGGEDQGEQAEAAAGQYWTCGMHPWVILPEPGDCPICHMKLTPLDPAKFTGEIAIDPVIVQNMGVRTADVTKGPLERTLRTVGHVTYDETRVQDINTKVDGWLERVYVDYVGAPVVPGQTLFDLYSPTLYSAQEELLAAVRGARGRGTGDASDMAEAARARLRLYDIDDATIAAIEREGKPRKALPIKVSALSTSPKPGAAPPGASGETAKPGTDEPRAVVVSKNANEGMRVKPGTLLYRIADLSTVWVQVSIYEDQLPYVSVGQHAVMRLSYLPGMEFEGEVTYIYPTVNEKTREGQARLAFANPNGLLKPGMFAEVELRSRLADDRVLAPREAILDTGRRQVAFVSLGDGKFEPRKVQLGPEGEGPEGEAVVQVLDGLKPGEKVVISGQFLLDSEANIRAGIAKMIKGEQASEQKAPVASAGKSELTSLPPDTARALVELLRANFDIQDALAGDTTEGTADAARRVAGAVDALLKTKIPEAPHFWHQHDEVATIRGAALALAKATESGGGKAALAEARKHFADLSTALTKLIRGTGVPPELGERVEQVHCPMYRDDQGGTWWLQKGGDVRNPYYGAQMLTCHDERAAIPETGADEAPKPADADGASGDAKTGHEAPEGGSK